MLRTGAVLGPEARILSATNRPVLPFSFTLGLDRGHAHDGGARSRRMAARMAHIIIERWRRHYQTLRPHSALNYRPPAPESFIPVDRRPTSH